MAYSLYKYSFVKEISPSSSVLLLSLIYQIYGSLHSSFFHFHFSFHFHSILFSVDVLFLVFHLLRFPLLPPINLNPPSTSPSFLLLLPFFLLLLISSFPHPSSQDPLALKASDSNRNCVMSVNSRVVPRQSLQNVTS